MIHVKRLVLKGSQLRPTAPATVIWIGLRTGPTFMQFIPINSLTASARPQGLESLSAQVQIQSWMSWCEKGRLQATEVPYLLVFVSY